MLFKVLIVQQQFTLVFFYEITTFRHIIIYIEWTIFKVFEFSFCRDTGPINRTIGEILTV